MNIRRRIEQLERAHPPAPVPFLIIDTDGRSTYLGEEMTQAEHAEIYGERMEVERIVHGRLIFGLDFRLYSDTNGQV